MNLTESFGEVCAWKRREARALRDPKLELKSRLYESHWKWSLYDK